MHPALLSTDNRPYLGIHGICLAALLYTRSAGVKRAVASTCSISARAAILPALPRGVMVRITFDEMKAPFINSSSRGSALMALIGRISPMYAIMCGKALIAMSRASSALSCASI